MGTLRSTSLACLSAWMVLPVVAHAQQAQTPQPPTFKSGTQVVEVDVRVFDKDGRFVTDLKPEDFIIKEDGAPQHVVEMTFVGGKPALSEPSAASAAHGAPGTEHPAPSTEHRAPSTTSASTWVFVFDTPHLSLNGLHSTQKAVADFIDSRFHQGDLGGVVFDGKVANNRLTSDREELLAAVDGMKLSAESGNFEQFMHVDWPRMQDEREAWMIASQNDDDALAKATQRACSDRPSECQAYADPTQPVTEKARQVLEQANVRTTASMRVIDGLCNGLAKMAGPKTIVYFSEGFFVTGRETALRDVTGLANRAGAHFYTVDARGLNHGSASSAILAAAGPMNPTGGPQQFDWNEDSTNALAVDTGGIPIRNENNFGRALVQIQEDAGTYYVIGYTPSNVRFDGRYRAIDVSVNRPGVKVRARRGYLALEPAKLLRPVAIAAPASFASNARPKDPENPEEPPGQPNPSIAVIAPPTSPSALDSNALRARIEKGGLLTGPPGEGTAPSDDPASRGWAAYQKGDVDTAARELKQAAASADARPWVHYVLGFCELALQHYPAAAASWEHVRAAVPTFEPVYFNLADAYVGNHAGTRAYAVLDDAAKRWPKDAEIRNAEGVIQIHAGALVDAIGSFERATKLAPKDPLGFFNLASAHHAAALRLRELGTNRRAQLEQSQEDRRLADRSSGAGFTGKALWHRTSAIQSYHRVIALKGSYVEEAKRGLAALEAK